MEAHRKDNLLPSFMMGNGPKQTFLRVTAFLTSEKQNEVGAKGLLYLFDSLADAKANIISIDEAIEKTMAHMVSLVEKEVAKGSE